MATQSPKIFNGIFLLKPEVSSQTLSDAIKARLCKAESLALLAASADLELFKPNVVSNYLWALSDLIIEIGALYDKL